MASKHEALVSRVELLEMDSDMKHRLLIATHAVILGVPLRENEDLGVIMNKICRSIRYPINNESLVSVKRLHTNTAASYSPPIVVVFKSEQVKNKFLECKRVHGPLPVTNIADCLDNSARKITIRDALTPVGQELLREVRQHQSTFGIKYVWPGRNGQILVKRADGAKVDWITNKQQLHELIAVLQSGKAFCHYDQSV